MDEHRVGGGILRQVHVVPDFVSEAEAGALLRALEGRRWAQAKGRRIQELGGRIVKDTLLPAAAGLPAAVAALCRKVEARFGAAEGEGRIHLNHVLVNRYEPGAGILPHEDGPIYRPEAFILSLGGPAVLRFHAFAEGARRLVASVVLQPRSLLAFAEEAYVSHLHGIDFAAEDELDASVLNRPAGLEEGALLPRGAVRTSFTLREVVKVRKGLLRL